MRVPRRIALALVAALVAALVSFAESYRGLYLWAHRHGLADLWALCVPKTSSTSCDQAIFVDQATGASVFSDAEQVEIGRLG